MQIRATSAGEGFGEAGKFLVLQATGLTASMALNVLLGRLLGAADYGRYAVLVNGIVLAGLLGRLGVPALLTKYTARLASQRRGAELRRLLVRVLGAVALLGALVALVFSFIIRSGSAGMQDLSATGVAAASVAVPAHALLLCGAAAMRALRRIGAAQMVAASAPPMVALAVVGLSVIRGSRVTLNVAVGAYAASLVVCTGLAIVLVFAYSRMVRTDGRSCGRGGGRRFRLSIPLGFALTNGLQEILQRGDIIVLNALIPGSDAVGGYAAARRVSTLGSVGLSAVAAWAAPEMASAFGRRSTEELHRIYAAARKVGLALLAPLALVSLLFGDRIIALFGSEFADQGALLAILVIGQVISAGVGPIGAMFMMTGRHWVAAGVLFAAASFQIVGLVIVAPQFGVLGAAAIVALSTALWNILLYGLAWQAGRLDGGATKAGAAR